MSNADLCSIYKPEKSRFYILFTASFYSFVFGFFWNSWQPIMNPLMKIYNWNLTEINLLINVNTIVFILLIMPFVLLWNKYGIRFAYYMSASSVFIGSFIRLYYGTIYVQSLMILIGNSVSALGNLISGIGCTGVSAIWFPSHERGKSTTTSMAFGILGAAVSPLVASYMVPDIQYSNHSSRSETINIMKKNLEKFMYIQCFLSLLSLLFIMAYFRSKPSIRPCKSSEKQLRINLTSGFKVLIRNVQFWMVFLLVFIVTGITSGMFSVLSSMILPLGITQDEAAMVNSTCNLCMFFTSIFGGWLGDRYRYKTIIWCTISPSILLTVIFGFQVIKLIQHDLAAIYAVSCLLGCAVTIIGPVSFEMGCEAAFPVSEEVSTAVLGLAANFGTMIFLFVTMIPNIGTKWIPFAAAVCYAFVIPITFIFKGVKTRVRCDIVENIGDS